MMINSEWDRHSVALKKETTSYRGDRYKQLQYKQAKAIVGVAMGATKKQTMGNLLKLVVSERLPRKNYIYTNKTNIYMAWY